MTRLTVSAPSQLDAPSPIMLGPQHWLAALAMLFVLFAPYQTLVQTVIIDDEIRLGVEVDSYDMIWVNVGYLVGLIYGLFTGTVFSMRIGKRYTLVIGLLVFCVGNVLCGAAVGLYSLAFGRFVEGFGKLMVMAVGRATLYKQFDRALLVAIGFYGVFAYSTRYWTPLINAYIDVYLSWRWTYLAYVPVSLFATVLVWCFFRPDRPPQPMRLRLDWLAITTFVAWLIAIEFAFSWYRRWGGWSSNAFVGCVALCVALPLALAAWLGSGLSRDEHLKHVLGSRVYVLSLMTRGLLLLYMAAVLTIVGMYCTELRGYPRVVAGWLMVPSSVAMATTTFLTTWFHSRALRHLWLIVGMIGCSASVWWLSSIDNYTSKEHLAVMLACWGAFLGLIPPVFLMDEVEGLEPKYMLYGFALGLVGLVVPIETVPNATSTIVKAWSDRAVDVYRMNLRENRPAVEGASARVADYFHQRGLFGAELQQETGRVLGGFATLEGVAHGFRSGLRFLSLMMLAIGLTVAILLARAAKGLRAARFRILLGHPTDQHRGPSSDHPRRVGSIFTASLPKRNAAAILDTGRPDKSGERWRGVKDDYPGRAVGRSVNRTAGDEHAP